jgi:ABC-type polysaccharide/polyol phosphate transport system ATPase subunit
MARIKFEDVNVRYPVVLGGRERSIVTAAAATASFGQIASDVRALTYVEALHDITLDIKTGDRVGLIGRNGSGKSTLLKTAAGMLSPSQGNLTIEGEVTAILRLGAGIHMDRSARRNMTSMARLIGVPAADVPDMTANLEEFTELGAFFDMPVRTYSAGMLVRLMFGALTYRPREILVVDEVIGAGDAYFITKAKKRALDLFSKASVLLMATHSPEILTELCTEVVWLDSGRIVDRGAPQDMWSRFHSGVSQS